MTTPGRHDHLQTLDKRLSVWHIPQIPNCSQTTQDSSPEGKEWHRDRKQRITARHQKSANPNGVIKVFPLIDWMVFSWRGSNILGFRSPHPSLLESVWQREGGFSRHTLELHHICFFCVYMLIWQFNRFLSQKFSVSKWRCRVCLLVVCGPAEYGQKYTSWVYRCKCFSSIWPWGNIQIDELETNTPKNAGLKTKVGLKLDNPACELF